MDDVTVPCKWTNEHYSPERWISELSDGPFLENAEKQLTVLRLYEKATEDMIQDMEDTKREMGSLRDDLSQNWRNATGSHAQRYFDMLAKTNSIIRNHKSLMTRFVIPYLYCASNIDSLKEAIHMVKESSA
ncbi:hypothetical protein GUITHDRAFT_117680 [Guillardia theta CCMP2712]|uniref:Uncharacterized protein n=1 Tax=Guillardia theta (strain CCMP2712) TaxID=905079 RepID=L1IJ69_GUITC|nr:hypothetical protein GUITHDRAFT_117680 [Guillardia theta CCMP2712]EKX36162.1 hypothetical protein GUITHDRAFT_117680 [Guillardia theta CCMP2712]|eukprot:XP_005823142.1 hypothetical protein GUITHDRAFT_117680 [Guillardia theta CCMP2712]